MLHGRIWCILWYVAFILPHLCLWPYHHPMKSQLWVPRWPTKFSQLPNSSGLPQLPNLTFPSSYIGNNVLESRQYWLPGNRGNNDTYCTDPLPPLPEGTLDILVALITKTSADTPFHTSLLSKIRVMGNTSLTIYFFPLIQYPLYLQYFSIAPPKIYMESVTHHRTPYSLWGSLGTALCGENLGARPQVLGRLGIHSWGRRARNWLEPIGYRRSVEVHFWWRGGKPWHRSEPEGKQGKRRAQAYGTGWD